MHSNEVGEKAYQYHLSGFHCAEAVFRAVLECYAAEPAPDLIRIATAFGGGIGHTFQDTCGAFTGAVMAAGYLLGRTEPGVDWEPAYTPAAALRERFVQEYGTTNCGELTARFEDLDCKGLSRKAAAMLADILNETGLN